MSTQIREAAGGGFEQKLPHGWAKLYVAGKVTTEDGKTKPKLVAWTDGIAIPSRGFTLADAAAIKAHFGGAIIGAKPEAHEPKPAPKPHVHEEKKEAPKAK